MASLLQLPPLAMFDPSLIHRNDEIFNPGPLGLGFFFTLPNPNLEMYHLKSNGIACPGNPR